MSTVDFVEGLVTFEPVKVAEELNDGLVYNSFHMNCILDEEGEACWCVMIIESNGEYRMNWR
jgi:hypothetical protein